MPTHPGHDEVYPDRENEREVALFESGYVRGLMDGWSKLEREASEPLRMELARLPHPHYSSMIGPYCVVCHEDMAY